ncbi:SAM-dependent methyltransferase [Aureimonas sp. Leaf324]|jgi:tRNA-Thr(GGU) m(6)t(6)A37 methyltransferase TsaA|uniref:SAM-dependent methyltransferase n=1 Tax=Aureimonas sp. Leaf324 TaxID=1736336 RepID=UPI0006F3807E|nr:SAM-dependent methyltransferase [Aureimonas sp. Leaf324]KQQ91124.1 tRNA-Thr(GGU) m(6)t(6)A37 methyltransferase TsaA [Aureimonas sp. Leaf324]
MSHSSVHRVGEIAFDLDPAQANDATLAFIGEVRSLWTDRAHCPRNLREARERGGAAEVHIEQVYRPALEGLVAGGWVHLLTWLQHSRRDLALQMPRHADRPRGTFSLRSPVRPNPIGLHLVRIVDIDVAAGVLRIDAIDVLDGTPLLDIKPYLPSVDRPAEV